MADEKGVAEPSSALEQAIASSPEVTQEVNQEAQPSTEQATPQQAEAVEQTEEAKIPYSRLKEVVDEKNWLKQQLELQLQQRQAPQQFQQPTQDPYAGMTAEERVFWQRQREIAREEALKVSQEQLGRITPVIDAGRQELAQMKVQQFRAEHPDIKPDSQDEVAIAQRISQGYTPDDAYWAVVGPRGMRVAQTQVKQQVKQQIAAKKQANVESSASIPSNAQAKQKQSFRDDFLKNFEAESKE